MKRAFTTFVCLLLLGFASAQQHTNRLAINGTIMDAVGPFYFLEHGDSSNAYVKASAMAEVMNLEIRYLESERVFEFSDGYRTVRFAATSDIADGLIKRADTVSIDPPAAGQSSLASPKAILVNGVSYVAVTPLVAAFEGHSDWHPDHKLVTVDTPDRLGYTIARPRTGLTDGVSRVALDVPADATYEVAADGSALLLTFPGARAEDVFFGIDDGNVASVSVTNGAGFVSIVVRTVHEVSAAGQGFKVGEVEKGAIRTVYVDLAPTLAGAAVTALAQATAAPVAVAESPVALETVPERRQVVVIDAGHGGRDPGATSSHATEKWVVLSVAMKLKNMLEREGIEVIMTRDDDTFLTLQQRSLFSSSDRNIFVSIHANSAHATSASGIETWVFGEPLNPSLLERAIRENGGGAEGQALTDEARMAANDIATSILRETQLNYSLALAETVQRNLVAATGAPDRGVRQNLFYVIRNARIPAVLVELGFVSNADEGKKLATDSYQETLARALADGLLEFLRGGGLSAQR